MSRAVILDKLNADDPHGAIAMLDEALRKTPRDPDVLGLKGIALADAGETEGAQAALTQALAEPADTAIRLRNGANLAGLLFESGKRVEAAELLKQGWRWEEARAPQENEKLCLVAMARLMHHLALHKEVITLLSLLPGLIAPDWQVLKPLVHAMALTGETKAALELLERDRPENTIEHERQALLAYLLSENGRRADAADARRAYLEIVPPVILPRRPSHKLTLGLVDVPPKFASLHRSWPRAYFAINYPAQLVQLMSDRYQIAGIFLGAGEPAVAEFNARNPDVVINNVTNAEYLLTADNLDKARAFIARVSQRVINSPDSAIHCTRQKNALNLAGIDGLIVPSVRRYRCDMTQLDALVDQIESETPYPMIVRTVYEQESRNMILVNSRSQLANAIRSLNRPMIYVIQYLGQPRERGYFRRIRSFFVGGQPFIIWADYAPTWIVRSRRHIDLQTYRDHPDLFQHANAIISKAHAELGAKAVAALEAVGRQIPLDIFGMDFDVDAEGRVVFFETNATMRMTVPVPEAFAYPPEATERLISALDQLIQQFATAPDRNATYWADAAGSSALVRPVR